MNYYPQGSSSNLTVSGSLQTEAGGSIIPVTNEVGGHLIVGNRSQYGWLVDVKGSIELQSITFHSQEVFISASARISVEGRAKEAGRGVGSRLTGANIFSTGGSHGGSGGAVQSNTAYGSFISPDLPGSRGGPSLGTLSMCNSPIRVLLAHYNNLAGGGNGGGVIVIYAVNLTLFTPISANGAAGTVGAGGGSGGSIQINTVHFYGNSTISNDGGDGVREAAQIGGGGSGGRTSIHAVNNYHNGTISARGGNSDSAQYAGGPGTVYVKNLSTNRTRLSINNNRLSNPVAATIQNATLSTGPVAWLTEGVPLIEIDEVDVRNSAHLAVKDTNSGISIDLSQKI